MSFARTYAHTCLVALDMFGASILFNRDDVTISSLCGLVRRMDRHDEIARHLIRIGLALREWQIGFLRYVGAWLEDISPGHCEAAIKGDINRASRTLAALNYTPQS